MYVRPNYKTKGQLIKAVNKGTDVDVYPPGLGSVPVDGTVYLEGPHYPAPHTWYAQGAMVGGRLVKVK